jgi:hypothetical protein
MSKIAAVMATGAATLALMGAPAAHADPDYTWECDNDAYGHTSCRAEPIPHCGVSSDGKWVVVLPPGRDGGRRPDGRAITPAPCTGGPPYFPHAPYPATAIFGTPSPAPVAPTPPYRVPDYGDADI